MESFQLFHFLNILVRGQFFYFVGFLKRGHNSLAYAPGFFFVLGKLIFLFGNGFFEVVYHLFLLSHDCRSVRFGFGDVCVDVLLFVTLTNYSEFAVRNLFHCLTPLIIVFV